MLTPQEVAEHAFAKASFGGYNMAMVDEFLDLLTADYTTLYKENAALKAKMKVLADKIEEYRATEEAMRKALLSAQQVAEQLVTDAEKQKAQILSDAEKDIQDRMNALRQEVESEQLRLTAAQNATRAYIGKLKDLHEQEIRYLSSLDKLTASPARPDPVEQAANAIGDAMEKAIEEEFVEPEMPDLPPLEEDSLYEELRRGPVTHMDVVEAEAEAESKAEAEDEEDTQVPEPVPFPGAPKDEEESDGEDEDTVVRQPPRRIFDGLKFGKNYHGEDDEDED